MYKNISICYVDFDVEIVCILCVTYMPLKRLKCFTMAFYGYFEAVWTFEQIYDRLLLYCVKYLSPKNLSIYRVLKWSNPRLM